MTILATEELFGKIVASGFDTLTARISKSGRGTGSGQVLVWLPFVWRYIYGPGINELFAFDAAAGDS